MELVMSFPVLMFLVAMLYTLYIATQMKAQVTMEVRHRAFKIRSKPEKAQKGQLPFGTTSAHSSGQAHHQLTRRVKVYRKWYPNVPRRIRWGNVVLTGTWDHRQVEFAKGGWAPVYPHFGILKQMAAAQGGVKTSSGEIGRLGQITQIPTGP